MLRVSDEALDPHREVLPRRLIVHHVGDLVRVDLLSPRSSVDPDHRDPDGPRSVSDGELDVSVNALPVVSLLREENDPPNAVQNVEVESPRLAELEEGLDVVFALFHLLQLEPSLHGDALGL